MTWEKPMSEGTLVGGTAAPQRGEARPVLNDQFRRFLDTLPAAAYTCDNDGLITYFNRRAAELWGREPKLMDPADRFCGSFKLFAVDGTPLRHDQCWMALSLQTGDEFIAQEILIERPDGRRMLALAHASPLLDESGATVGGVNVIVEGGAQRESELALARLGAIVESSDDAIVSKSLDGTIESWNAGAERIFGWTAEEAIGQPITIIIPPDRRDEERGILAALTRGERIDHLETERITKAGERITVSLTTSPVRDRSGKIVGASKVARDISARRQADLMLASLVEQRSSQLADLTRLREMGTRLWTAQEVRPILEETLRTAAAIQNTDLGLLSMWNGESEEIRLSASLGFDDELKREISEGPLGEGVILWACRSGDRLVIEDVESDPRLEGTRDVARKAGIRALHSTPLLTRDGQVVGILSTFFRHPHTPSKREMELIDLCASQAVDFIENAQLQAQLREADERKNHFLAILAHELRNPLAPIRNAIDLVRRDPVDQGTLERTYAMMERQVSHMVRLIDDLMDVSRITRGRLTLRKERTTLSAVIESAIETCRPAIESAGHHLTCVLPSEPVALDADPTRLAQVFANLIGNAAKYTPDGGRIRVETETSTPGRIVVRVKDDGLGIPASDLETIFESFTQVGEALDRSQGGLGIGLSLVRGLAELHGGTITAKSEGPGMGSEFEVELPLPTPADASPRVETRAAANSGGAPRCRVLVVDDNEDAAASFSLLIGRKGHETRIASDGLEALAVAAEFRPEIVFLDIGLPKLNGYEVAKAIRAEPWGRSMVLIALTGWGLEGDKKSAAESGFDLHLVKPIDPASVGDLIQKYRGRSGDLPTEH
jgi:PAS domain S-box-containing protein